MNRVVLFSERGGPLLLSDVKMENGAVKSGWVVNGAWRLIVKHGQFKAWEGKILANTINPGAVTVVKVPDDLEGDYNEVIAWAEDRR